MYNCQTHMVLIGKKTRSAMLRKEIVQGCDTHCTAGDCKRHIDYKLIIPYYNP